jgi:hypothetical protein
VAHANQSYARPNGSALPSNVAFNSDFGSGSSGPGFFQRLFGAPQGPPEAVGRKPQQQQRRVIAR